MPWRSNTSAWTPGISMRTPTLALIGTDHELCESRLVVDAKIECTKHETRQRVWKGGVTMIKGRPA